MAKIDLEALRLEIRSELNRQKTTWQIGEPHGSKADAAKLARDRDNAIKYYTHLANGVAAIPESLLKRLADLDLAEVTARIYGVAQEWPAGPRMKDATEFVQTVTVHCCHSSGTGESVTALPP